VQKKIIAIVVLLLGLTAAPAFANGPGQGGPGPTCPPGQNCSL